MNIRRRPSRFARVLLALPLLALFAASAARATSVCVSSSAQLQAKLAESALQAENAPYTIKLVQGTYNFGWGRVAPTSQFTLAGGYGANCSNRNIDPDNTVIDFGGNGFLEIFQATASPIASVTVEGITFRNGEGVSLEAGKYNHISDDAGNVSVRNSRFTALTSNPAGQYPPELIPVYLESRKGNVSIVNTVFDHLHQAVNGYACEATLELLDDASATLMFDSVDTSLGQSFCIYPDFDGGSNVVQVFNSIFWPSDGVYGEYQPLHFGDSGSDETPPDVSLYYNTIRGYDGGATVQDFFTRSANPQDNPQWISPIAGAGANYGLLPTSTSINSGFPSGIIPYPTIDIASNPRVVGGVADRGAVESPYVDTPSTIVTNTNDSGPGSLRAALATAGQFDNPDTITFSLPSCPAIIKLNSALPIIHAPLTIDGYANNPLAVPNSDPNAFNASLCVAIVETVPGSIISGLTVDTYSGGLTLRGIAFGGFFQQVSVLGGSDHYLSGNQFGGNIAGIPLAGANNNAIFVHGVESGTVTIGGPTPGDRNDIVNATRDGIFMDGTVTTSNCHINNNLIGLMPNGIGENGNEYGIELQNNHCEVSKNKIAANLIDGIWINGGRFNLIQGNVFGLNADGNATQSYGWAVRVDGSNNVIGAPQTVGYLPALGNAISFMGLGGILVNGINDSVRANLSSFNGNAHDGSAPDIKLAVGGNFQQPAAVIDSLALPDGMPAGADKQAAVVGHLDSGANGTYRVDAYYSATCAPGGHGHAEYYLATQMVTTNAGGHATFSIPLTLPASPATSVLSLAATDNYANSSEMGACFAVGNGTDDTLFKNGFNP